jgi:hypothetical protein
VLASFTCHTQENDLKMTVIRNRWRDKVKAKYKVSYKVSYKASLHGELAVPRLDVTAALVSRFVRTKRRLGGTQLLHNLGRRSLLHTAHSPRSKHPTRYHSASLQHINAYT